MDLLRHQFLGTILALLLSFALGQFVSQSDSTILNLGTGCSVTVKDDFSGFYPMLFDKEGNFWPYEKSTTEEDTWNVDLESGQEMIASCAPNYLRNFNNLKSVTFSCQDGKLLNEAGLEKKWKDVNCELRPVEEVIVPVDACDSKTNLGAAFGFVNPVSKKAIILGNACYSQEKGQTNFVHLKLKPKTKSFDDVALEIESENYFRGKKHPSGRYKIDLMKAWGDYTRPLEDDPKKIRIEALRYAFPQSVYLSTMKKLGWNYGFSQEGFGVWPALQEEVKSMVEKKEQVVDYYAGGHGILKANEGGEELYLKEGKFPVPEYLWMFVREGVQGLAFVVYNKRDMSTEEGEKFQFVCSSKCDQVQWLSSEFKAGGQWQKYVLCCDVNDARASIAEMPLVTGITHTFLY